ncbi:acyl-CoA dehydrogenase family member 10-like [Montipora capricornis]|uniref:acyl-CoA dehydrogenase family member 10-like n=1 Tax=Montipora capricornis TaxID=246305 RepID=UPI0035F1BC92
MISKLRGLRHQNLRCLYLCHSRHYGNHESIKPRAVAFDMGGVLIPSPLPIFNQFEDTHGLKRGAIVSAIEAGGDKGVWAQLERGQLLPDEFSRKFAEILQPLTNQTLNMDTLLPSIHSALVVPHPEVLMAMQCIRAEGLKTALITNNWWLEKGKTFCPVDKKYFDVVVESAVEGTRKPEEGIYFKLLERLELSPTEVVFLDDFGRNLKVAKILGFQTIKVDDVMAALHELETRLSFPLKGFVPGTTAVRKAHQISFDSLQSYLQSQLGLHQDKPPTVRQFKHGQSNPTYYIEYGGERLVIRKKPPGKLLPSAHAVEREYKVMTALGSVGVPVPKTLALCEDSSILGTPFYVMEYKQGRLFKDPSLPGMTVDERKEIYHAMNETLFKIHNVDIDAVGLGDFGKRGNYVRRQTERWAKQYEASKTHDIPTMDKLASWLLANVPVDDNTTVVHGDFRLDNLIFDENKPEVIAVLDWELSTLGDPLSDLAYCCLPHHLPPDFPALKGFSNVDPSSLGIPTDTEYMKEYCQRAAIPVVANWNFYMAFSFFRVAAILQGVYKRALQGQASSQNAKAVGMLAETMAKTGWKLACEGTGTNPGGGVKAGNASKRMYSTATHTAGSGALPIHLNCLPSRVQQLYSQLTDFMQEYVYPKEAEFTRHQSSTDCWTPHPLVEKIKEKARSAGLWNLFIPLETDPEVKYGAGLTNVEYAYLCEQMGRSVYAPEMFNCSAPDTGNMEVLIKYGTDEQKERWLQPLLDGKIRSCFAMTEPKVASSDATNIESSIKLDGNQYVINGRKWWTSGGMDPRCKICIFMGKTDPDSPKHKQQAMILVPMETPGVRVVRPLSVFGYQDPPCGHAEVLFEDVRVPKENILLGPGRGFEIAQGRLGPGRIHHCMRLIGQAERSLELMIDRVKDRVAFGKPLVQQGTVLEDIAESRIEIEQARLLTLKAAHLMDTVGNKVAAPEIAMIKVVAPKMAQNVVDRAMQAFGGAGLSSDLPLALFWSWARILRLADGPDEVHLRSVAKREVKKDNYSK